MMRVRRQIAIGQVDAPAIEKLASGRDSDEQAALLCSATPTVAPWRIRPVTTPGGPS
jgi:hypothetical protein